VIDAYADLDAHLAGRAEARLADFVELLRIPSISTSPERAADVRAAAMAVADRMRTVGLEHVEVAETGGHPVVYGDWLHAEGAPTILAYAHYDVQPVDPLDLWVKPPFDPRVEGGRVYARGASDDKSHVHMHLQAIEAWLSVRGHLPINLRLLYEGEEESGSANLERWVAEHRDQLAADLAVVSDTGFLEGNLPAITNSLRGMVYAQIDVRGSNIDLHSGGYGGMVRNPATALATILASLHDADERVAIPGFYDAVRPPTARQRAEMQRLPFDEAAYRERIGVSELVGEAGWTPLERRGLRPTCDVNGLWGGFQEPGAKTIIPAHAHAKVSCRLVPDQDPEQIFELLRRHVLSVAPSGVEVDVQLINVGRPCQTPVEHPATEAAARCIEAVFGQAPYFICEGGSVPVTAVFTDTLELPVVLLGFMNPDDQAHAPNESLVIDNYERGIRTIVRYWDELARTRLD
jgi:acetylornithine deacetylase/succinyl-diaminopimelate desuccinylase-like protein